MNKKRLIKKSFPYLKDFGFEYKYKVIGRIIYYYYFVGENASIILYEDYRCEFLDLIITKHNKKTLDINNYSIVSDDKKVLEIATYKNIIENTQFNGVEELEYELEKLISAAFEDPSNLSIMNPYFKSIVEEYSKFIKANLKKILD